MKHSFIDTIHIIFSRILGYMPDLAAALIIILAGWIVAYLVKRLIVRLGLFLKLHRLAGRLFTKGDVRHTFLNILGNTIGFIVFLIFLDNALLVLKLTILERMIQSLVFFIPDLILASIVLILGFFIANRISLSTERLLTVEGFNRAYFLSRLVRAAILLFVTALALVELHLAPKVVLAAFLITFSSLGITFILAVGMGSREAVRHIWSVLLERKGERTENSDTTDEE